MGNNNKKLWIAILSGFLVLVTSCKTENQGFSGGVVEKPQLKETPQPEVLPGEPSTTGGDTPPGQNIVEIPIGGFGNPEDNPDFPTGDPTTPGGGSDNFLSLIHISEPTRPY